MFPLGSPLEKEQPTPEDIKLAATLTRKGQLVTEEQEKGVRLVIESNKNLLGLRKSTERG